MPFSYLLICYFRDVFKRGAAIFSGTSNLRLSGGYYDGLDLIPKPFGKDASPKPCDCGVNKCIFTFIYYKFN